MSSYSCVCLVVFTLFLVLPKSCQILKSGDSLDGLNLKILMRRTIPNHMTIVDLDLQFSKGKKETNLWVRLSFNSFHLSHPLGQKNSKAKNSLLSVNSKASHNVSVASKHIFLYTK